MCAFVSDTPNQMNRERICLLAEIFLIKLILFCIETLSNKKEWDTVFPRLDFT